MFEYVRLASTPQDTTLCSCGPLFSDQLQLWQVESNGEERKVEYLATLSKHTQAVNVVRWSPRSTTVPPPPSRRQETSLTRENCR